MRLAYRKIKTAQPKMLVGVPGIRDPENRCPMYAPRKRRRGDSPAECETDGHYLCNECAFKYKTNKK